MDRTEIRAVIKFFHSEGKTATEMKPRLDAVLGNASPSFSTVNFWVSEFKRGRSHTIDAPCSGRPKTATTPEIVDKIHDMVLADRRIKVREIVEAVSISYERVVHILHNELGLNKLSARWVPHLLNSEQKRVRAQMSADSLEVFKRNPTDFKRRFVTMDETWIHHYTPETKIQSKQWIGHGESVPKKAKVIRSAGKVMASVFWDAKGILLIDYLQKGKTVTGQYYGMLLDKLKAAIRENRPGMAKKKVLFHHDNAPAHSSAIAQEKLSKLKFEILPHPPYSPDLVPSDFHVFPKLKTFLAGKRYQTNEEAMEAVNEYFGDLEESHFRRVGVEKLEKRWTKCIELRGDYVEK
ncbi:PREDICTED: histone-lysine N-methyltransferase SETMAR-like [Dufourea novaeangliae]|uniref:histone-lysine N-methyltransferase SETMAR-like n=1 Tax=Dufourea novaeangliae TaxID=178035 RepID=UPI0007678EE2|nr:PREDICTED: histone-lysine N-methyltransferase SETMAR-like [Dufourea novaeangliae]